MDFVSAFGKGDFDYKEEEKSEYIEDMDFSVSE